MRDSVVTSHELGYTRFLRCLESLAEPDAFEGLVQVTPGAAEAVHLGFEERCDLLARLLVAEVAAKERQKDAQIEDVSSWQLGNDCFVVLSHECKRQSRGSG